jgi:hypothetical protein
MDAQLSAGTDRISLRTIAAALGAAVIVILGGLAIPGVKVWKTHLHLRAATDEMSVIRTAVLEFMQDTGLPPTRGRDGNPHGLLRLIGPGAIPENAYYASDSRQGRLVDHLVENAPEGASGSRYPGWHGPYLDSITPDPWGTAYVVVAYPLYAADGRDCIVVSAGPDGAMDGDYSSPRDPIAAGDDLVELIADR